MSRQVATFDVAIVGGGPAGIAAAVTAAGRGKRVALIESAGWLGGQIWRGREAADSPAAREWLSALDRSSTHIFTGTTVIGAPAPGVLLAERGSEACEFQAAKTILAVGARELFIPFPGWTLPNVFGPGGLQVLAKAGWPVAGKRVVIAGSGPLLIAAAAHLRQAGARIVFIAEQADWRALLGFGAKLPWLAPDKLVQGLGYQWRLMGVPYRAGWWPVEAHGKDRVEAVTLRNASRQRTLACDYLACGFGLVPNLELPRLCGCRVHEGSVWVDEWQETSVPGVYCAGEPTGIGGLDRALVEGRIAALAALEDAHQARRLFAARQRARRFSQTMAATFAPRPELKKLAKPDTIVCRCEDVVRRDLDAFDHWRAAKLHTRCGMGACQGRICGGAVQVLYGWENDSVRPPIFPVKVGTLAESGNGLVAEPGSKLNKKTQPSL